MRDLDDGFGTKFIWLKEIYFIDNNVGSAISNSKNRLKSIPKNSCMLFTEQGIFYHKGKNAGSIYKEYNLPFNMVRVGQSTIVNLKFCQDRIGKTILCMNVENLKLDGLTQKILGVKNGVVQFKITDSFKKEAIERIDKC